ncbi:MAG: DNA mismatch repair protein MutS, partial [Cyanobacteriota bacterium]
MAAEAEQQLSLVADLALQGDLFAGSTPAVEGRESGALDEEALTADAHSRPRTRRPRQENAAGGGTQAADLVPAANAVDPNPEASDQAADGVPEGGPSSGSGAAAPERQEDDLPPWHHHSLVDPAQLTPVLRHYVELKAAHPERVLLYRLGDFYEFFFEDAILLSRLLELTLTGKEGGKGIGRVPMAGIPYHAAERYCAELVRRGLSVALCDQLETTPAKGGLLR